MDMKGKTVVIASDNQPFVAVVKPLLERMGATVTVARSVKQTSDQVLGLADLLIIDDNILSHQKQNWILPVNLPGVGPIFARYLREDQGWQGSIVFCTASDKGMQQAKKLPGAQYIAGYFDHYRAFQKPAEFQKFLENL